MSRDFDDMKAEALRKIQDVTAKEYDPSCEKATPEQLLLQMAIRNLTEKQRTIWEWWAYDKRTEEEIGLVLGVSHQAVSRQIKTIEHAIEGFCKQNRGAYMLLKLDQRIENE